MSDKDAPDTGNEDSDDGTPDDNGDAPDTGRKRTDWKAEADRLAAESRKWENRSKSNDARLKELEPLARKAKELEDASKSDIERATAEAQQHQSRAEKAEGELMRLRVALRKGLSEVQAKRLVGSSEDELEADADDLMASFRPPEPEKKDSKDDDEEPEPTRPDQRRRPQERLRPGAVPEAGTEPEETDPRKLAAMVPRPFS